MHLLLFFSAVLMLLDWGYMLLRLRKHRQLLPVNKVLIWIPFCANLYLRFYLSVDRPTPGTASPETKAMLKKDAEYGGVRVNVEMASHVNF
ncbi:hypothetical protein FUA23_03545 [Neolewinella aurantiaca]|uniref:Uncharacterized protein n=1 Tax=Neolewinella aurantiaca TaxID=2602767 RepID=A0A5C7FIA3_9BACT|nr:hypothetical protein [Neolewinella aurantiaca]TXF90883.1 hypothetical protein FUA23_03545 [Neolewinella aurantiaca]